MEGNTLSDTSTLSGFNKGRPIVRENIDFYFDDHGMLVFTAEYLKKRGKCCNNGCKHCPYKEPDK